MPQPSSSAAAQSQAGGPGRCNVRCKSVLVGAPEGPENNQDSACEELQCRDSRELGEAQRRQQDRHKGPVILSPQEVAEISEVLLGVILEHEADMASVVSTALSQCGSVTSTCTADNDGSPNRPNRGKYSEHSGNKNVRQRLDGQGPFAVYSELRPAFFQELRDVGECTDDLAATQALVPEEDLALYTRRTVAVLLLAGRTPIRVEDLRKCWLATPQHMRKRNFAALVLGSAAKTVASCLGLQLLDFHVRGAKYVVLRQDLRFAPHLQLIRARREEELRGFLLFLCAQFLSEQAELSLELLKSNLRLVGRSDLLKDFDESSLFKAVHLRDSSYELDSLGALLTECETRKYIVMTRRSFGAGEEAGESLFVAPTQRLVLELQLDSFRSECRSVFDVEPPSTPFHAPDDERVDSGPSAGGPSQNEAL